MLRPPPWIPRGRGDPLPFARASRRQYSGDGQPGASGVHDRARWLVEDLANPGGNRLGREPLLEERRAGFEDALVHDGVVGMARHVEDAQTRIPAGEMVGQLASADHPRTT